MPHKDRIDAYLISVGERQPAQQVCIAENSFPVSRASLRTFLRKLTANFIIGRFGCRKRKRYFKFNPALGPRVIKEIRRLGTGVRRRRLETGVVSEGEPQIPR
jgi:hypothetical protein